MCSGPVKRLARAKLPEAMSAESCSTAQACPIVCHIPLTDGIAQLYVTLFYHARPRAAKRVSPDRRPVYNGEQRWYNDAV